MNTLQQFKLNLQIRIGPAVEFGSDLIRDIWQQVLAEREARVRLMTDGHFHWQSLNSKQESIRPE